MIDSGKDQIRAERMASLERGAHEADNVYAFDPNEEDDADLETSRLPLLIAIALVVLAAFAGVVWLAYTQGVEEGRADAPRLATAQTHTAPPKTTANPYAGLNIYQPPASSDAGNEPIAPVPSGPNSADNSQPPLRPSANAADKPAPQTAPAPPKPAPLSAHAAPKAPASANTQTLSPAVAPPAQMVAAPTPESTPSPVPPAHSTPQAAPTAIMLQIGSYKSDAEARQSWAAFKARHALAAAFGPDVKEVDLGAKGVWYRLRIGSFQDREAAAAFCEKLKAQGASCIVSR